MMPSPFPGMDPYLESRTLWPSVHHNLISEIHGELNRQLRPRYRASIEERVYLSDDDDPGRDFVIPDVHLVRRGDRTAEVDAGVPENSSTVESVEIATLLPEEIHEPRIEILDTADRSVITLIEVMSLTNRLSGSYGRESYLQKRHEVMRSSTHFVEIDLLRAGVRHGFQHRLREHDSLVHISRALEPNGRRGTAWPIPITFALPVIPIPLKTCDADGSIDLQKILAAAYDRDACDLAIDYGQVSSPPLTSQQSTWARELITRHLDINAE